MESLKTAARVLAVALLCCFCLCFVAGFLLNLSWHLVMFGPWGSLALVAGCICIFALCRKKAHPSPK
jgi:hypothetical protein